MRIDHIQLAAPKGAEADARRFFVDVLEMVEEPKPEALRGRGGCWFRRETCAVHIGIESPFRPQQKAHPAFGVADARGLAARLQAAGHAVRWDDAIPGVARFYTTDPFGNRLEFIDDARGDGARRTASES